MAKKSSKKTPEELRLKALRQAMKAHDLDAFVVRNLTNVRYLCGFVGSFGMLVVDERGATFFTDSRYAEMAEGMVSGARIKALGATRMEDDLKAFFKKKGFKRAGFEGSQPYSSYNHLKKLVAGAKSKLVETEATILELRRIKDDTEIRTIRKAAKVADAMMARAFELTAVGVPESEISQQIRFGSEQLGGAGESFDNIVASGPNASRPHHHPTNRKLRAGDMITYDLGAIVDGYCSDLTRTPILGDVDPQFEEIYTVCLEAQEAAVAACTAGITGKELDAVAREIIKSAGYGKYFGHGLGHGVGLEIHEAPRLSPTSAHTLRPGDVVTIEPGIYIPGFGGVRIEDLLVVTDGKPKVLSRTPKGLTIIPAKNTRTR